MHYKEWGFTKEDKEFLEAYPKLYPISNSIGLSKKYFDTLFCKMEESLWMQVKTDNNSRQNHLRSMIVRLDHFNKSFELIDYKDMDIEELSVIFGEYNSRFAFELLKVI